MERDAVRLVQRLNEPTQFDTHDPLERHALGRDHIDRDVAVSERRRHFQANETCTGHDDAFRVLRLLDDRLAVAERTQVVDVRCVGTRDGQVDRLCAGGNQKRAERTSGSVFEQHLAPADIDRRHVRGEHQLDPIVRVELWRPQRNPVLLRGASQIVLRQVRPVGWRRVVGADDRDLAVVPFAPQHVGGRQPRRAAADDHDGGGARSGGADLTTCAKATVVRRSLRRRRKVGPSALANLLGNFLAVEA